MSKVKKELAQPLHADYPPKPTSFSQFDQHVAQSLILIIEDNQFNLWMAKDLLQDAGFRTLEAECAEVGLQLAKAHKPDLILLDMNMPQMNGYDTVRLIRTDPELCDTIVIAFTALAMDEELKKAISCGCNNIIAKPINVDTFANSVERFLDLARI